MIEIAQAGQVGKTSLLLSMHRLRKRVFKDRMGWDVTITPGGLEIDQFDIPEAIYLLATNRTNEVIGSWRLLPTNGPTMIREIWPQFLDSIEMPADPLVWEASRFSVDNPAGATEEENAQLSLATQELFCALTELCIRCGIRQVFTMYDMRIARLLKRLDCAPKIISTKLKVDEHLSQVGCFVTDEAMLARLRQATGIEHDLVTQDMVPPALQETLELLQNHGAPLTDHMERIDT